jgi:hypothetical protein
MIGELSPAKKMQFVMQKIEDEKEPLRNCLHYREAVDLVPELLKYVNHLENVLINTQR